MTYMDWNLIEHNYHCHHHHHHHNCLHQLYHHRPTCSFVYLISFMITIIDVHWLFQLQEMLWKSLQETGLDQNWLLPSQITTNKNFSIAFYRVHVCRWNGLSSDHDAVETFPTHCLTLGLVIKENMPIY